MRFAWIHRMFDMQLSGLICYYVYRRNRESGPSTQACFVLYVFSEECRGPWAKAYRHGPARLESYVWCDRVNVYGWAAVANFCQSIPCLSRAIAEIMAKELMLPCCFVSEMAGHVDLNVGVDAGGSMLTFSV
jgi:hypothetical protein